MNQSEQKSFCAICVDMGTTNTRVWLVRGDEVLARRQTEAGVRDTAREGSSNKIRSALRELIADIRLETSEEVFPTCVAAAGMITSPLGLAEVPHLIAPAGLKELSAGVKQLFFPEICELPFLFVPGIRSGAAATNFETINQKDVMRGEETLCVGLIESGRVQPPATILNLGSHWKAIRIDAEKRIAASLTSLSGELIHVTQTNTILASAVPAGKALEFDADWCEAGMNEQRRSGLARALFCVRLFELGKRGTPEQRMSFLIGAYIASDLDALLNRGLIASGNPVLLTGSGAAAIGWQQGLKLASIKAEILSADDIEKGLIRGLKTLTGNRQSTPL